MKNKQMDESITSINPLIEVAQPMENDALLPVEQSPELVISQSALSFVQTSPDPNKPCFQVLMIAQQQPNTSVTITSDKPECFQIAADSRPAFLPTLTITPSPQGTYVHVRYLVTKGRLHTGQLFIQDDWGTQTVNLEGRKKRIIPAVRQRGPYSGQRVALSRVRKPQTGKRLIGLLALSVLISLVYLVFMNRTAFFSADSTVNQAETKSTPLPSAQPAEAVRKITDKKTAYVGPATQAETKPTRRKRGELPKSSSPKRRSKNSMPFLLDQARDQEVAVEESSHLNKERIPVPDQVLKKQKPRAKPVSLTTISELEQVINQPKAHRLQLFQYP